MVATQLIVQVGLDPATWFLHETDYEAVAAQLGQATGPVVLPVFAPYAGRLVLNVPAAGSVCITSPAFAGHGTHPSDGRLPGWPPVLYVPVPTLPPSPGVPGFFLDPATDVAKLEQEIVTAMAARTAVSVPLNSLYYVGAVVLSGASLSYCVLCPPRPPGPLAG